MTLRNSRVNSKPDFWYDMLGYSFFIYTKYPLETFSAKLGKHYRLSEKCSELDLLGIKYRYIHYSSHITT